MVGTRHLRLRFHVSISSAILAVIVAVTLAAIANVYFSSTQAAKDAASTLFSEVSARVVDQVDRQMADTMTLAGMGGRLPAALAAVEGDGVTHPVVPYLIDTLANDRSLYSLYYGYDNGDFLQVIAARQDGRIVDAHKAPASTWMIVRAISGQGEARVQSWTYLDPSGSVVGTAVDPQPAYDPRQRGWYKPAMEADDKPVLSSPYLFNSLQQPGITASRRLPRQAGVFGVDITLSDLNAFVGGQRVSANGAIVLVDDKMRVLAAGNSVLGADIAPLSPLDQVASPMAKAVLSQLGKGDAETRFTDPADLGTLMVRVSTWQVAGSPALGVAVLAPFDDFTGHIRDMQRQMILMATLVALVILPLVLVMSRRMGATVRQLADEAQRVQHFDFSGRGPADSFILEFYSLADAFASMKESLASKAQALEVAQGKLEKLVGLGIALSAERDINKLMEMILMGAKDLTNADGGTLYIRTEDETLRFQILRNDTLGVAVGGASGELPNIPAVALKDADGNPNHRNVVSHCVHEQMTINIVDAYDSTQFDFSGTKIFDERNGYRSQSFLTVPLKPRGGDIIGALQLINARVPGTNDIIPFDPAIQSFVEALSAQAATALYNRQLLEAQEELMDSMIQIIAGAIDAKSPYTGGHCERVPELALMLAEEAGKVESGPLADFAFKTEEEWREFKIGAWLHDCGKVVTPEYVVDKATKLETIYNRIHEVRTRFEVLLRDAVIEYMQGVISGNEDEPVLRARMEERRAQLLADFSFVAECNVGGEFMAPDKVERLKQIAQQTWVRTFDDRLGLSHEELKRFPAEQPELPVVEKLLDDKPWHIIPRPGGKERYADFNFNVTIPENLYNFGEVYNLAVSRGTLSEEERFKINEHIMQTIAMLERLPFPKHMKRVPEYAGTHHETMIGTGYPRKLTSDQLSVPSRIMAIADIFEALTASDRPYKKAKTLSESIKILSFFKKDKHIDSDLFDLFLTSGVYRQYAERFLLPEQMDEVDIDQYLTKAAE
ncbi:MAG: GAF domain-containing protein [Magnetospirillum sp.]|nr:GAF domain-containing protein [Magnetospirillum sp.]